MSEKTFFELETKIQVHFSKNEFQDALQLIDQNLQDFPDQIGLLHLWKITLTASIGDSRHALDLLQDSTSNGFWYSEILLRLNPNLKSLHGDPEFEFLVDKNVELKSLDEAQYFPTLVIRPEGSCYPGGSSCPLLVGLHDNRSSAYRNLPLWEPAAVDGWLVAAVQSSLGLWKGAFAWEDPNTAAQDVKKGFDSIKNKYEVQQNQIVVAGISGGALPAIQLSIQQTITSIGFMAIMLEESSLPLSLEGISNLPADQSNSLRGHFIINTARISPDGVYDLIQFLEIRGVTCSTELIEVEIEQSSEILKRSLVSGLQILSVE